VSRQIVGEIERRYACTTVVALSASPDIIASRLAARGREDAQAISQRIARMVDADALGPTTVRLDNSGTLVIAGECLVDILQEAAQRQVWPARA
jgi:ribose 1,5-bisphosphokinase